MRFSCSVCGVYSIDGVNDLIQMKFVNPPDQPAQKPEPTKIRYEHGVASVDKDAIVAESNKILGAAYRGKLGQPEPQTENVAGFDRQYAEKLAAEFCEGCEDPGAETIYLVEFGALIHERTAAVYEKKIAELNRTRISTFLHDQRVTQLERQLAAKESEVVRESDRCDELSEKVKELEREVEWWKNDSRRTEKTETCPDCGCSWVSVPTIKATSYAELTDKIESLESKLKTAREAMVAALKSNQHMVIQFNGSVTAMTSQEVLDEAIDARGELSKALAAIDSSEGGEDVREGHQTPEQSMLELANELLRQENARLKAALSGVMPYLRASNDPPEGTLAVMIQPAQQLRNAADALEKKDAAIYLARTALKGMG
jgi:hypothetical protein